MQEVNFGEAILLEQDDNKLLVDCGAKYEQKGITAANSVKNLLLDLHKEALVTHFHEDHYNGFTELAGQVIFKRFYLPLFEYKKSTGLIATYKILDDTVKIWAYQKLLGKGKKLDALHRFFLSLPQLVRRRDQVICVKRGDIIKCGSKQFEIIWPKGCFMDKAKIHSPEIEEILRRYIPESIERYITIVDNYTSALTKLYVSYVNSEDDSFSSNLIYQLEQTYERLDENSISITLDEKDIKRFSSIVSQKIKCMNDCSVVMQCDEELLMLGDIGKNIFEKYISPDFRIKNKYKAVKVSHHGTKAYFSYKLPDAKAYLISNSGKYNTRWSIYEEYPCYFSKSRMICTNTNSHRCHFATSPCSACCIGVSSGNHLINLDIL